MSHRAGLLLSSAVLVVFALVLAHAARVAGPMQSAYVKAPNQHEAGKYLVIVGGCNDCHTPDWQKTNGNLAAAQWLTGNSRGFKGPWGTSYASNLRLFVRTISEDDWMDMFRTRTQKPPMPWMNLRQMSDRDARALRRFLLDLGPAGQNMPKDVEPAATPETKQPVE